jgi:GNAT superfamily N-acetyltransferase
LILFKDNYFSNPTSLRLLQQYTIKAANMADYKADFIKIPTHETNGFQTKPVEPQKRLKDNDITIEHCTTNDAVDIAKAMYACMPERFWTKAEPPSIRDPDQSVRQRRLTARILPMLKLPNMKFIKAVHVPSGQFVGVAGWAAPGLPLCNPWRRDAVEFYGYKEMMGWNDDEVEEMWRGSGGEAWGEKLAKLDDLRRECVGDEGHWFLAPLLTLPDFQGRGVGSKLLNWAIEQADAKEPPTPMYLESAPTARAVYMHWGFVPQGEVNFLRKGPAVVRGLEAEVGNEESKIREVDGKVENRTHVGDAS